MNIPITAARTRRPAGHAYTLTALERDREQVCVGWEELEGGPRGPRLVVGVARLRRPHVVDGDRRQPGLKTAAHCGVGGVRAISAFSGSSRRCATAKGVIRCGNVGAALPARRLVAGTSQRPDSLQVAERANVHRTRAVGFRRTKSAQATAKAALVNSATMRSASSPPASHRATRSS